MKNKVLSLLTGVIIGVSISCVVVNAKTSRADYDRALEQIEKADNTRYTDRASGHSNRASAHLLKAIYEEQKEQTKILKRIEKK